LTLSAAPRILAGVSPERPERYHHGDLPNALKAAAIDVITEKGVAGFSLREVARRAGVSHAAPAHHFGDSAGLLTALATDALEVLHRHIDEALDGIDDPVERLVAAGRAYVDAGVRYPAFAEVTFRRDVLDVDDPAYQGAAERAYASLVGVLEQVRDQRNPDLDVALAARHCWATMQGLLVLYPMMAGRAERHGPPIENILALAEHMARLTVGGLLGN